MIVGVRPLNGYPPSEHIPLREFLVALGGPEAANAVIEMPVSENEEVLA